MKIFALLLMALLIVGCGKAHKPAQEGEDVVVQTEDVEQPDRDEDADDDDDDEEEESEDDDREEEVENDTEEVTEANEEEADDTENYVYESGTVTWSGAKKVGHGYEGTVDVTKAEAVLDGESLVSAMFELDMTTINSGNGGLDGHLKNADFFDVENHPTATLKLDKAVATDQADVYTLSGTLEIMNTEKPISFPATVKNVDGKVSAQAEFEIDRTEWGITYGSGNFFQDLGDKVIKDEVGFVVDVTLAAE